MEYIREEIPRNLIREANEGFSASENAPYLAREYDHMTYDKIVELNKQIKKKINELKRAEIKWDIVLKNSFFLEDVIESEHSIDWRIRSAFFEERRGKFGKIMDHLGKESFCI